MDHNNGISERTPRRASPRARPTSTLLVAASLLASCAGPGGTEPASDATPTRPVVRQAAAPRDAVESVEPWSYNNKEGKCLHTPNYAIYATEKDPVLMARLPIFVEAALANYRSVLGTLPPPPGPMDTFVMGSRMDWELLTKQLMGPQADVYLRIRRGGYAAGGRGVYYGIGAAQTLLVAAHEGWHQYTQRTFKNPLPIWLEEGIATYMEGNRWDGAMPRFMGWANTERFDQLRDAAARGTLLGLAELTEASPQELLAPPPIEETMKKNGGKLGPGAAVNATQDRTLTFYAQIWALVHFLQEGEGGKYRASFATLLADAADGRMLAAMTGPLGEQAVRGTLMTRRGPGVLVAYFNPDLSQMGQEYSRFIEKIASTGSRSAIVEGKSPVK